MKRNYWPIFFIGIFTFVFSMIVWTVKSAVSLPVIENHSFMKKYQDVDKDYNDILGLRKEIALALGIDVHELDIVKINDNEIKIKVQNMKKSTLSLKELLEEVHDEDNNLIPLGLSERY